MFLFCKEIWWQKLCAYNRCRLMYVPQRCAEYDPFSELHHQGLPWRVPGMRAIQRMSCLRWRRWCVVRRQKSGDLRWCTARCKAAQILYQNVTKMSLWKNCYSWDSKEMYFKMNRRGLTVWCSLILDLTKCLYINRIPYWRWGYHPHSNLRPCNLLWLRWEMKMQRR